MNQKTLKLFIKGVSMGAADVVPGVSGGTVAFITGVYDELLASINAVRPRLITTLFQKGFAAFWKELNGSFLLTLGSGIALSILSLAHVITYLLSRHPIFLWSLFSGLILASSVLVGRKIRGWSASTVLFTTLGCLSAVAITNLNQLQGSTGYLFVFLSGCISICAMILPGISGSFILVLLGMYSYVLTSLKSFDLPVIIVFSSGCLVGLLSFSKLLSYLLDRYEKPTLGVLLGFMLGSLGKIWPWKVCSTCNATMSKKLIAINQENASPFFYQSVTGHDPYLVYAILLAVGGFVGVLLLERLGERPQKVN